MAGIVWFTKVSKLWIYWWAYSWYWIILIISMNGNWSDVSWYSYPEGIEVVTDVDFNSNAGGIKSKRHTTGSIPAWYSSILSHYQTWCCAFWRTNSKFNSTHHTGRESHQNRINVKFPSGVNILLRLALCCRRVICCPSSKTWGIYNCSLRTLIPVSQYAFFYIIAYYPLILQSPCFTNLLAGFSSLQLVYFQSFSLSGSRIFYWSTFPHKLIVMGPLPSPPSTSQ